MERRRWKTAFLQAVKIAVGSSAAIYIAESMHLKFGASAGSIALLTIVATKWETVKLSFLRVITFVFSVALICLTISLFRSEWVAYGAFIFALVMFCEFFGWKSAISVNSVIGTHFLSTRDFSIHFILNELLLILIGISVALLLNLFHNNSGRRKEMVGNMRLTEKRLQMILGEITAYLSNMEMQRNVWEDLKGLEDDLHHFINDAYNYQNNTFSSHPGYYIDYFEMRLNQCHILHNLHHEMRKIREIPAQAGIIAEYILYMADYVVEKNAPQEQIEKLEEIFETMKKEPLPSSREEFENRAILYHILMDLEEFLIYKKKFVQGMNEEQRRRYWE